MNILFATQAQGLGLFAGLGQALAKHTVIGKTGFTVTDRWAYHQWIKQHPDFEAAGHVLVKDWEITAARVGAPDRDRLAHYERTLAGTSGVGPGLFGAIVADRRLLMGPDCTYVQDYRRRFSDDELLRILENGCSAVETAFDKLKPDLVIGFICNSLLEYLVFLFARARGIRYLNIRTSRIGNRVLISDSHRDPAPEVAARYAALAEHPDADFGNARALISETREDNAKYEGVTAPSNRPARNVSLPRDPLAAPFRFIRSLLEFRACGAVADNHCPGLIRPLLFKGFFNPIRARRVDRLLRPQYLTEKYLNNGRYAVFPLHTEPEISLQLYGRPLLNQIEIVRAIALSLPADMTLAIKEHPWMVGKRSLDSYRKFQEIPRVHIAAPEMELRDLIANATLITILTGSSGIEAAVLKKPVVTLGPSMINLLPDTMVEHCRDFTQLPESITRILMEHHHDEPSLERLFLAILENTTNVNLYSGLLGRTLTYARELHHREDELDRLAEFTLARANQPYAKVPATIESGSW